MHHCEKYIEILFFGILNLLLIGNIEKFQNFVQKTKKQNWFEYLNKTVYYNPLFIHYFTFLNAGILCLLFNINGLIFHDSLFWFHILFFILFVLMEVIWNRENDTSSEYSDATHSSAPESKTMERFSSSSIDWYEINMCVRIINDAIFRRQFHLAIYIFHNFVSIIQTIIRNRIH